MTDMSTIAAPFGRGDRQKFRRFRDHIVQDAGSKFFTHMYALIRKVYEQSWGGKYLTLEEAKKLIPHDVSESTVRRYFVKADAHGFLEVVNGFRTFERKSDLALVMPGPKAYALVRGDVEKLLGPKKKEKQKCFFVLGNSKREEAFPWSNPDGSVGGWVAKSARIHKTAIVEPGGFVAPGQVVGPRTRIKNEWMGHPSVVFQ